MAKNGKKKQSKKDKRKPKSKASETPETLEETPETPEAPEMTAEAPEVSEEAPQVFEEASDPAEELGEKWDESEDAETTEVTTEPIKTVYEMPQASNSQLLDIPLEQVTVFTRERVRLDKKSQKGVENPAPTEAEFQKGIKKLAEDIKDNGLIHAILVRPLEDGSYELVCGYRRFLAHNHLKETTITSRVKEMTETQANILWTVENTQREDLSTWDKFQSYLYLKSQGLKSKEIGEMCGVSRQTVDRLIKLRETSPKVQQAVKEGLVSVKTALAVKDKTHEEQESIIEQAIEEKKSSSVVKAEVDAEKREEDLKKLEEEERANELADTEALLASKEARYKQLDEGNERRKEIEARLKQLKVEIAKIRTDPIYTSRKTLIDEFDSQSEDLQKNRTELAEFQGKLEKLETDKIKFSEKFGDVIDTANIDREKARITNEIHSLKQQKAKEEALLKKYEEQLIAQNQKVSDLDVQIKAKGKAVASLTKDADQYGSLKTNITTFRFKVQKLESNILAIEEFNQKQLEEIKAVQKDLGVQLEIIHSKEEEIKKLQAEKTKYTGFSQELRSVGSRIKALQRKIAELAKA